MGLVKGFSSVLAPHNLAVNGSFKINQRGRFTAGYARVHPYDFVSDGWQVIHEAETTNVLFLEAWNDTATGRLCLRGSGRRGESVWLSCSGGRDLLASIDTGGEEREITACVTVSRGPSLRTIPVEIHNAPAHLYPAAYHHTNWPVLSDFPVHPSGAIRSGTQGHPARTSGLLRFVLMADGDFDLVVQDYCVYAGLFAHPPKFSPVPLGEDLLRCKRYYQRLHGTALATPVLPIYRAPDLDVPAVFAAYSLDVEMFHAPNIVVTNTGGALSGARAGHVAGAYTFPSTPIVGIDTVTTTRSFTLRFRMVPGGFDVTAFPFGLVSGSGLTVELAV